MIVAASVTVAQLIMLKGPIAKREIIECTTVTKKKKKREGRVGWRNQ